MQVYKLYGTYNIFENTTYSVYYVIYSILVSKPISQYIYLTNHGHCCLYKPISASLVGSLTSELIIYM
jgi:hypothetical protein